MVPVGQVLSLRLATAILSFAKRSRCWRNLSRVSLSKPLWQISGTYPARSPITQRYVGTDRTKKALNQGFSAFKLKVGSPDESRDLRRAAMLRNLIGEESTLMFDANQHWHLPDALRICRELAKFGPHWIEEPTDPDDIQAHVELSRAVSPTKIAAG